MLNYGDFCVFASIESVEVVLQPKLSEIGVNMMKMRLNCVHFWLSQKMDAEVGVIGSVSVKYALQNWVAQIENRDLIYGKKQIFCDLFCKS